MPLYMQISLNDTVIHLSEHHGDASPGGAIRDENRIRFKKLPDCNYRVKEYLYSKPRI